MEALGYQRNLRVLSVLALALRDPDAAVRSYAADAVRFTAVADAETLLRGALLYEADPCVQVSLLCALVALRDNALVWAELEDAVKRSSSTEPFPAINNLKHLIEVEPPPWLTDRKVELFRMLKLVSEVHEQARATADALIDNLDRPR